MSAHLLYSALTEPEIGAHKHGLSVFHDRLRVKLPLEVTALMWDSAPVSGCRIPRVSPSEAGLTHRTKGRVVLL